MSGPSEGSRTALRSEAFEVTMERFTGAEGEPPVELPGVQLVVVGGGISGLAAAWKTEASSVLVLEQRNQLGGNARLEERDGLRFAGAGPCIQLPAKGSPTAELLSGIGLWDAWRDTNPDMMVMFDTVRLRQALGEIVGAMLRHPGELLDPAVYGLTWNLLASSIAGKKCIAASKRLGDPVFAKLYAYLDRFRPGSGKHPAVPWSEGCGWSREEMERFDAVSLHDLLFNPAVRATLPAGLTPSGRFGALVEDAVETTLRVECLSPREVSAYVGLHFLTGYLRGSLVTFPGGNGFIAQAVRAQLERRAGCTLRKGAQVQAVRRQGAQHVVEFEQGGRRHRVQASAVIWAAPKYAALPAIEGLPSAQRRAMQEILHRDYCAGAAFIRRAVLKKQAGGYVIDGKKAHLQPYGWCRSGACLVANWQDPGYAGDVGVLTLLKPIAGADDQGKLDQAPFAELQRETHREVAELLKASGLGADLIEDIKLWRWSRGLVVSRVGQLAANVFQRASQPFGGIFFANQDSVGVGNLESAVWAGFDAAARVGDYLRRRPDAGAREAGAAQVAVLSRSEGVRP